jgi:succinate dehydrogenase / fumarate reductase membrane anchor subunit
VTAVAVVLSGLWLLGVLLSLRTSGYNYVRDLVVDPINATLLVVFLLSAFWHARLGLQVIIEDYVHTPLAAGIAHFANIFVCALASIAGVLAVLRIALGS